MDKFLSELLHPFTTRIAAGNLGAVAMFWSTGLLLFHFFHPQPVLFCAKGGTDFCGLLSGDGALITVTVLLLVVGMVASSLFSRATGAEQFLTGCNWRLLRGLGLLLQDRSRRKAVDRAHPNREIHAGTATVPRGASRDGRATWRRYPHGTPRKQHHDPLRPNDVALEPTLLGNVFAASRQRVMAEDDLPLHECWHILLAVLPEEHLARLKARSAALLSHIQAVPLCVATAAWAAWLPGVPYKVVWVLAWLSIAYAVYREACKAAGRYCECIEGLIRAHRDVVRQKMDGRATQLRRWEQSGLTRPYDLRAPD
jgi:hypothetical protein